MPSHSDLLPGGLNCSRGRAQSEQDSNARFPGKRQNCFPYCERAGRGAGIVSAAGAATVLRHVILATRVDTAVAGWIVINRSFQEQTLRKLIEWCLLTRRILAKRSYSMEAMSALLILPSL
jgi:hypothetical protein